MQLNQPIPPPYSGGDSQFDFILNGNQKPKKTLLPTGGSRKQRLLIALGIGAGVIVLLIIIVALLLSSGKSSTKSLISIAQTQNEIVRISSTGSQKAKSKAAANFSITVADSTATGQAATTKYLASKKVKIPLKTLALGQNPQTDAALKSAQTAGRYDEELISALQKLLLTYQAQVSTAYKATNSTSQKTLLKQLFDQINILLKSQPATTNS